ncbi:MAG TPA: transcriptional repressor [Coriobacteriia bacterium]|nr:transcriptional repressor [Coriobacteriia bacterium]
MSVPEAEAADRVARFTGALRSCGFRLTHQRLEVVREVASTDAHPDADQVFRSVRGRVPTISLDTVYRTLGTLTDLGLVSRVQGVTSAVRFDANSTHHHHFVCSRCGRIDDVESSALDGVSLPADVGHFGSVDVVEVRFRGVCRACAEEERS